PVAAVRIDVVGESGPGKAVEGGMALEDRVGVGVEADGAGPASRHDLSGHEILVANRRLGAVSRDGSETPAESVDESSLHEERPRRRQASNDDAMTLPCRGGVDRGVTSFHIAAG